ncbi:MAG: dihydropyrimidinase [Anaerolineales bacterium]|nr:dihydropyrimidinase [Anaerolineales bacterium]
MGAVVVILIKSGKIINAHETKTADILIKGEKIIEIGDNLDTPDAKIIDAAGMLVFPGGIDPHTHFDLPMFGTVSSDDHYTGHKAAAFGGTTTVIDFINQLEGRPLLSGVEEWHAKADEKAAIDWSFHMNLSHLTEDIKIEIPQLLEEGITTLKVFTAYNHRLRLQDHEIFQVMRIARDHGMLTLVHAENGDVIDLLVSEALAKGNTEPIWHARTRPALGAVESALRAGALAGMAEAPIYLVHMNTAGEVDMLDYARSHGIKMMGETCPQYLYFSEDDLLRPDGSKWICSPPMRTRIDNESLLEGLSYNKIQVVATDHCPFYYDGTKAIEYEGELIAIPGKELGKSDFTKIPNGLPGVGDRMPILWSNGVNKGQLTPQQFVALTSTNPARIFGLYPQKGIVQPGADADIVIWDPEKKVKYGVRYAQHRTDYNLYENWDLVGFPIKVFLRGNLIVSEGNWLGKRGQGRFIKRNPGEFI